MHVPSRYLESHPSSRDALTNTPPQHVSEERLHERSHLQATSGSLGEAGFVLSPSAERQADVKSRGKPSRRPGLLTACRERLLKRAEDASARDRLLTR